MKHRWIGAVLPPELAAEELSEIVGQVLPGVGLEQLRPLTGGFRNWNFLVHTGSRAKVLRVYPLRENVGGRVAQKEQRLAELLAGKVNTPKYERVETVGERTVALRTYVEGHPLHELFEEPSFEAVEIGRRVGDALACVHAIKFEESGDLDHELKVAERYTPGATGLLEFASRASELAIAHGRLDAVLVSAALGILESNIGRMDSWSSTPSLTHGDFGATNLVVGRDGAVSVLDWEFACSAHPALDFGNLLRPPLEDMAEFSNAVYAGYLGAGGSLPSDWCKLARLADLTAWAEFAARPEVDPLVVSDASARFEGIVRVFG